MAVTERPILMSGPMVRAILAGAKTQTRRVMKAGPQPTFGHPQYSVGSRLWARETWKAEELPSGLDGIRYRADDTFRPIENTRAAGEQWVEANYCCGRGDKWRPSIFMPRWASRLTLEITGIRCERLQSISAEDARAEGIEVPRCSCDCCRLGGASICPADASEYILGYAELWEQINGKGSWDADPWVWVVSFRRIEQPAAAPAEAGGGAPAGGGEGGGCDG